MLFFNKFQNKAELDAHLAQRPAFPDDSWVTSEDKVYFNELRGLVFSPNAGQTATLDYINGTSIYGVAERLEISYDYGESWQDLPVRLSAPIEFDSPLIIRGINSTLGEGPLSNNNFTFIPRKCTVSGDIMGLFDYRTNLTGFTKPYACYKLFDSRQTNADFTLAPDFEFPTQGLTKGCFGYMFAGCKKITETPNLYAPILAEACYEGMFQDCTRLTATHYFHGQVLADSCYKNMYAGCTALETLNTCVEDPKLATNCFDGTFSGCTALKTVLPITTEELADSCYVSMYYDCTSLESVPENMLPATTLAVSCYQNMFRGCDKLVIAPKLPATELVANCYAYMFSDCSSLNEVHVSATAWDTSMARNWLRNVASVGTLYNEGNCDIEKDSPNGIPVNWVEKRTSPLCFSTGITKTGAESIGFAVSILDIEDDSSWQYKIDDGEWTKYNSSTRIEVMPPQQNLYFKADHKNADWAYVEVDGYVKVSGSLKSLNGDSPIAEPDAFAWFFGSCPGVVQITDELVAGFEPEDGLFSGLFMGTDIYELPPNIINSYTSLGKNSSMFSGMFKGTLIESIPEDFLPKAPNIDSAFASMFNNCTSLVDVPTNLLEGYTTPKPACFASMFEGCSSLVVAPTLYLESTDATMCLHQMYQQCTKLSSITTYTKEWVKENTELWTALVADTGLFFNNGGADIPIDSFDGVPPGWTLVDNTPLYVEAFTQNNEANATVTVVVSCTSSTNVVMYSDDKQHWKTLPLSSTLTLNDGERVYFKSKEQATGDLHFTVTGDASARVGGNLSWVNGVVGTTPTYELKDNAFQGLFKNSTGIVDASDLLIPFAKATTACYKEMFKGCSSLTELPLLKTNVLANSCFYGMFQSTGIVDIPKNYLPALTLATSCYSYMFSGCTNLKYLDTDLLPATTQASQCYAFMFSNCTSLTAIPVISAQLDAPAPYRCYYGMFMGCRSLASATVPFNAPRSGSHQKMFADCVTLCNVIVSDWIEEWSPVDAEGWLSNVASAGHLRKIDSLDMPTDSPNGIPTGWFSSARQTIVMYSKSGATFTVKNNASTSATGDNRPSYTKNLGANWYVISPNGSITSLANTPVFFMRQSNTSTYGINLNVTCSANDVVVAGDLASFNKGYTERNYTYNGLFYSCTGICDASGLYDNTEWVSTATQDNMYYNAFYKCSNLQTVNPYLFKAPSGATGGANYYRSVFDGCTLLTRAPYLPAPKDLPIQFYARAFTNCTSLQYVPKDFFTKWGIKSIDSAGCYSMFSYCSSLSEIPTLPDVLVHHTSTSTASPEKTGNHFTYMFQGCTSLKHGHVSQCTFDTFSITSVYVFSYMYSGCSALTELTINTGDLPTNVSCAGILSNTQASFTQIYTKSVTKNWYVNTSTYSDVYLYNDDSLNLVSTSGTSTVTVTFDTKDLTYSTTSIGWTPCTSGQVFAIAEGDSISFRGTNNDTSLRFAMTGSLKATGTLAGLYYHVPNLELPDYAFAHLFEGCTALVDVTSFSIPYSYFAPHMCDSTFKNTGIIGTTAKVDLEIHTVRQYGMAHMYEGCLGMTEMYIYKRTSSDWYLLTMHTVVEEHAYDSLFRSSGVVDVYFYGPYAPYSQAHACEDCKDLITINTMAFPNSDKDKTEGTYYRTFAGCTALEIVHDLPFDSQMQPRMYEECFDGCSKLRIVSLFNNGVGYAEPWPNNLSSNWLRGVASEGKVGYRNKENVVVNMPVNSPSGKPVGWTWNPGYD